MRLHAHHIVVLALLVPALVTHPASAVNSGSNTAEPEQALPWDKEVWVRWSLGTNLEHRSEIEDAHFQLPEGFTEPLGLIVYNNHSSPIRNVTLVVVPRGIPINLSLQETHAGDPPQRVYAFWHEIPAEDGKFVILAFSVPEGVSGAFEVDSFVTFEDAEGLKRASLTTIRGEVDRSGVFLDVGGSSILVGAEFWVGGIVATLTIAAGIATYRGIVKRKRTTRPARDA